jgi:membrane associated rhomboid family serine protease
MQAAGDRQANKALLLTYTLLPTGAAAIFGVLAQPFLLRRRLLLSVGTSLVVFGAAAALGVEALA